MASNLTNKFPSLHDAEHLVPKSQHVRNQLTIKDGKLQPEEVDAHLHLKNQNWVALSPNIVPVTIEAHYTTHPPAAAIQEADVYINEFNRVDEFATPPHSLPKITVHDAPTKQTRLSPSMRETLMPDENAISSARFHIIYIVKAFLVSGLIFAVGKIAGELINSYTHYLQSVVPDNQAWTSQTNMLLLQAILGNENAIYILMASQLHVLLSFGPLLSVLAFYAGAASALLFFLWRVLQKWTTEIILTDRRLLFKRGVIFSHFIKIDLRQMYQTEVNQSILGKLLGYGSVYIYTTLVAGNEQSKEDDRNISLPPIAMPHKFGSKIESTKRALRLMGD